MLLALEEFWTSRKELDFNKPTWKLSRATEPICWKSSPETQRLDTMCAECWL